MGAGSLTPMRRTHDHGLERIEMRAGIGQRER
jgi:hypothetical protein